MTERMDNARKRVLQLTNEREELTLREEAPIQTATNAVLYGTCNQTPIVFKFFERPYRKLQEERQLKWLKASGVVPILYPYEFEDVLVMERLSGQMLWQAHETLSVDRLTPLYRQVGAGLAKMAHHGFTPGDNDDEWYNPYLDDPIWHSPFATFWNTSFTSFFDNIVETGLDSISRHRIDAPEIQQSLINLQAARTEILAQPTFMHVDDVHGANIMVKQDNLQGFIDFEMSRFGNELYLLGATLLWACLDAPEQWPSILSGYEEERGKPLPAEMLKLLKICAPFKNLIRFAWYWGSEEQPEWVWAGNVRQKTVESLVETIERVKSIT